ncbi:MAG: hypothetical protein JJ896_13640 [Rhodothermales bacterium]|nr:hypothetical protein [Rhodothermales bacterium]MBO6780691.1 hypothetical protein [Rhodothermales bacterium]
MEFPTNRRDQIVMGLSICALILFMANIASFVKQRFFEDRHTVHHAFQVQGLGQSGGWDVHVHEGDGNYWSEDNCDDDRKRYHEHFLVEKLQNHARHQRGRFAWRFEDGDVTRIEVDEAELVDIDRLLEEARRAARNIERDLDFEAPRLHVESLFDGDVEVLESQDETGRHRYRIVVRPDDNQ